MKCIQPAILVVDDDPDACHNISDILNERGYAVDTAQESNTALRLVERQPYDLALLDLRMPDMDGLILCREVTRLRPTTVALLVTNYPEDIVPAEVQAAGARRVLTKPLDVARLLTSIEESLNR